tara:strand:+ start:1444 stop:1683 length:240 start_codon:yes stop_codon:yes gene_type:complete
MPTNYQQLSEDYTDKSITLTEKMRSYYTLIEEQSLPPNEQIELLQFLLDTEQINLTKYKQLADYYILEGLLYEVGLADS